MQAAILPMARLPMKVHDWAEIPSYRFDKKSGYLAVGTGTRDALIALSWLLPLSRSD